MNRTKEQWAATPYYADAETGLEAQQDIAELRARVEELDAYNVTRTDELLAATRRIAELEAERDALRAQVALAQSNADAAIQLAEIAQERANRAVKFNELVKDQS